MDPKCVHQNSKGVVRKVVCQKKKGGGSGGAEIRVYLQNENVPWLSLSRKMCEVLFSLTGTPNLKQKWRIETIV